MRVPVAVVVDATSAVNEVAPDTVSVVRVPTLVILGWEAVWSVPARVLAVTCPETPIPPVTTRVPVDVVPEAVPAVSVVAPDTVREVSVPRLVTLGWEDV